MGILVKEGRLNVETSAPVAEWRDDDRNKITLNHLLQASSGLEWSESYFNPAGSFHQMFIKTDDKGAYAASKNPHARARHFFSVFERYHKYYLENHQANRWR